MKPIVFFCVLFFFWLDLPVFSQPAVAAWGDNTYGQTNVPAGLTDAVAVAAGGLHSMALRSDGTVVAWGYNGSGQCNVPMGLGGVQAIAAGDSFSLALLANGKVVGWGNISVPGKLADVAALAAGSSHALALESNGTVVAFGTDNTEGQLNVPAGLSNVIAVAAGTDHSLALQSNGSVVGWGNDANDEAPTFAAPSGVTAIAAGEFYSVLLLQGGVYFVDDFLNVTYYYIADSSIVYSGAYIGTMAGEPASFSAPGNILSISVRGYQIVALNLDGTVIAWGINAVARIPAPVTNTPAGLDGVSAIAAGYGHVLALQTFAMFTSPPLSQAVNFGANVTLSVGAISNVREPGTPGTNYGSAYFGLWAVGKNFAISAWNATNSVYFQAVGDPLVTK